MRKPNSKNERVKRAFFSWLKEADGCCESTVNNVEKAILLYEDFTRRADFSKFRPDTAIKYKKWLKERTYRGRTIALSTCRSYLKHLQKFLMWLSRQRGYKQKIKTEAVDYLKLTNKEEQIAIQAKPRNFPPLKYVKKLCQSIEIKSEVDRRDRALIAFTLISGMRVEAIVSLPMGCIDTNNLIISQNPQKGVRTKFSKNIESIIFAFDEELLNYVLEWVELLKSKGFGSQDPVFPKSKCEQTEGNLSFESAKDVTMEFWTGTGRVREIFKKRASEAGLQYFSPHTYRHLAVDLAWNSCATGEQLKAVSQNFGHEHIATTLSVYANMPSKRMIEVLKGTDFTGSAKVNRDGEVIKQIKNILDK